MKTLLELLSEETLREGFPWSGGVNLDDAPAFHEHYDFYKDWISRGFHGEMNYLERGLERRGAVTQVFPKAKSVYTVAFPYPANAHGTANHKVGVQYARYLRGRDYHDWIRVRLEVALERVARALQENANTNLEWKICVDTSAVLERSWAYFSGLGWIGKNTMMIHPTHGSFFLVGVVFLSEKLEENSKIISNFCGNCSLCIDSCPTGAFPSPGVLDANRCLSYWTLEKRGETNLTEEDMRSVKNWVSGCDICQDVCPFNRKTIKRANSEMANLIENRDSGFRSQPHDWKTLLEEVKSDYDIRVGNSALDRVKWENFQRNLAWAFMNAMRESPQWVYAHQTEQRLWIKKKQAALSIEWLIDLWREVQVLFDATILKEDASLIQK